MKRRFGFVWGKRNLWTPPALCKALHEPNSFAHASTGVEDTPDEEIGVALGLQFALKMKRGRNEPIHHLEWRLRPKTSLKAVSLRNISTWDCRAIAGVIGSRIWQVYASGHSFSSISHLLDLSARVINHARKN